jgi:sigma-54 dependent transcriptional regulator, acetoin dehydrogenase operon transcriptional activator AcoR
MSGQMASNRSQQPSRAARMARDAFLATTPAGSASVRNSIRRSWERSRAAKIDTDRPAPLYVPPAARASVLTRAALPVLTALSAELTNEPICLILTDAHGVVLWRSKTDASMLRSLDSVRLAPGFSYSETAMGTNGIGTALEVGEAILINGAEHYTDTLCVFSCAGATIKHPVTGGLLGIVDITTESRHSNTLLLSFAKLAASRIQERILDEASSLDKALLGDYHLACRHSGGAVLAVGNEVFMMNTVMQQHFDAGDQAAIIDRTRDAHGLITPYTTLAELPSGLTARLSYQPTFVEETLAGGIVQIKVHRARSAPAPGAPSPSLPGLAGDSTLWHHITHEVLDVCNRGEWVILQGEPGVGKQAVLRSAHARAAGARRLAVIDGDHDTGGPRTDLIDEAAAALDAGADLTIRHAHALSAESLARLAQLLQSTHDSADPRRPWVSMTVLEGHPTGLWSTQLLGFFPRTVDVPPLRHHLADVPALVRMLLNQAGVVDLSLSSTALNQLMRLPWAGNVTQLREVLVAVSKRRRSGEAGLADLPPECRSTARRQLTPLEAMERDAIIDALARHDGDKFAASAALGISRATIYRKIRLFEIQA